MLKLVILLSLFALFHTQAMTAVGRQLAINTAFELYKKEIDRVCFPFSLKVFGIIIRINFYFKHERA